MFSDVAACLAERAIEVVDATTVPNLACSVDNDGLRGHRRLRALGNRTSAVDCGGNPGVSVLLKMPPDAVRNVRVWQIDILVHERATDAVGGIVLAHALDLRRVRVGD